MEWQGQSKTYYEIFEIKKKLKLTNFHVPQLGFCEIFRDREIFSDNQQKNKTRGIVLKIGV